jgi:hypothetical protein
MLRAAGWIAGVALAVPVFMTFVVNTEPSATALERHGARIAAELLAVHSSPLQPLMTAGTVLKPPVRVGIGHLRFEVVVTMRLRVPLYTVAHTNGTEAYRQIQRRLEEAKERVSKLRHFKPPVQAPELPDMPLLLQLAHRMGEPLVVTVQFDAHRFGWKWRLEPQRPRHLRPTAASTVCRSSNTPACTRSFSVPRIRSRKPAVW